MRRYHSILLAIILAGGASWPQPWLQAAEAREEDSLFYAENTDRIRYLLYWHMGMRLEPKPFTQQPDIGPSSILPNLEPNANAAKVLAVCRTLLDSNDARDRLPAWAPLAEDAWLEGVLRDFDRATAKALQQQADLEAQALADADPTGMAVDPFNVASGNALARSAKRRMLLQELRRQAGARVVARATRWASYYINADAEAATGPAGMIYWLGQAAHESQFPRYRVAGTDVDARTALPIITDTWPPRQTPQAAPEAQIFLATSRPVVLDAQAVELTVQTSAASPQARNITARYDVQRAGVVLTPTDPLPHEANICLRLRAGRIRDADTKLPLDADGNGRNEVGEVFELCWQTTTKDSPPEPPQFTPPPKHLTSTRARSVMVFSIDATDPQALPIRYESIGLPKGAQFDPHTRIFYWQPTLEDVGQYRVTFQADNGLARAAMPVTLSVLPDPTVPYTPPPETQPEDPQTAPPPPPKPTEDKLFE